MTVTNDSRKSFYVPTVDVAPYLANPHSSAARGVIDEVRAACLSTGFFQIVGHGISKELQQNIFSAAASFFCLPFDEKKKLDASKTSGHRGYDVLASQSYEEGVMPDLKEGYYVGGEIPTNDSLHGRFFSGPNVWPRSDMLPASKFQIPCLQYHEAVNDLSAKILWLVGATLVPENAANERNSNNSDVRVPPVFNDLVHANALSTCPLRLLHYPSATRSSAQSDKPQYGASAHTDFGAITLLLQDENPGLEVLDTSVPDRHVWRPIDPNPDAYVVNIGDMISMVTGNTYKSSVHRVVCKRPEKERYSVVFFYDGCLDATLKPVDGFSLQDATFGGDDLRSRTVEQHMIERLTMSYGTGAKDVRRDQETESVP